MHVLATVAAMAALAAAPCAWDTDPREPPAIAAVFAGAPAPTGSLLLRQDKALFPSISGAARASGLPNL